MAGICVTLVNSDVAGCVSTALSEKSADSILDDNQISILQAKIPELKNIVKNTSDSKKNTSGKSDNSQVVPSSINFSLPF